MLQRLFLPFSRKERKVLKHLAVFTFALSLLIPGLTSRAAQITGPNDRGLYTVEILHSAGRSSFFTYSDKLEAEVSLYSHNLTESREKEKKTKNVRALLAAAREFKKVKNSDAEKNTKDRILGSITQVFLQFAMDIPDAVLALPDLLKQLSDKRFLLVQEDLLRMKIPENVQVLKEIAIYWAQRTEWILKERNNSDADTFADLQMWLHQIGRRKKTLVQELSSAIWNDKKARDNILNTAFSGSSRHAMVQAALYMIAEIHEIDLYSVEKAEELFKFTKSDELRTAAAAVLINHSKANDQKQSAKKQLLDILQRPPKNALNSRFGQIMPIIALESALQRRTIQVPLRVNLKLKSFRTKETCRRLILGHLSPY